MRDYSIIFLMLSGLICIAAVLSVPDQTGALADGITQHGEEPQDAPVMLADKWDGTVDAGGWWMSEKFDGVRGYWTGSEMVSRSGIPFHTPEWFVENFPPTPLDGELWMERDSFAELLSVVRRRSAEGDWKKVSYLVFDAPQIEGGFEKRLDAARRWFDEHPNRFAEVVGQEICRNNEHLHARLKEIVALGGEGVMLRRADSPYTVGRSGDLLKVKLHEDAEAVVIKHLPGSGRNAGRLGSLLVELPNGIRFAIGSGFSDLERDTPPPVGSTITFKFYGLNKSGIPRFASFLRVRGEM